MDVKLVKEIAWYIAGLAAGVAGGVQAYRAFTGPKVEDLLDFDVSDDEVDPSLDGEA